MHVSSHPASVDRRRRIAALAAALLTLACLALALGCGREQSPLGSGAILGAVLDEATGEPVEGAEAVLTAPGSTEARAIADASGRFRLDAPSTGSAVIRVRAEGYEEERVEGVRVGGDSAVPVEVRLRPASGPRVEVRGSVRDREGRVLSGVLVATGGARTRTRADGAFRLAVPTRSRVMLTFRLTGYATLRQETPLTQDGARVEAILELSRGRALTGRVIDAHDGSGVAGATITGGEVTATSEAGGFFRLEGLAAGTLAFEVTAPGYRSESRDIEIPDSSGETTLDVPLVAPTSGTLRLRVCGRDGAGLAGAVASIEPGGRSAVTGGDGTATIEHVAVAECRLRVAKADWGSAAVEGVRVSDSEPTEVAVEIKPTLAGLRGSLVDVAGHPVAGARLAVSGLASGPLSLTADEAGRFEAHDLFVGDSRPRLTLAPAGSSAVAHVTLEPGGCVDAGPLTARAEPTR